MPGRSFRVWEDFLYPGTEVLRNKAGLRDAGAVERFERGRTFGRLVQLRAGQVTIPGRFDLAHLQAVHAHIFQDVYGWAGQVRAFPLFKGRSEFCRPEFIVGFAADLFDRLTGADHLRGRTAEQFVTGAADLLADLNALHPFREGDGRSQRAFVELLARHAGHEIVWPDDMEQVNIAASVASLHGNNRGLVDLLSRSVVPPTAAAAQFPPNAAQIAALSFPRPLRKVRPASSEPKPPSDQPSRRRSPPGLSL